MLIKYISEIKADINLCPSSFSVETFPFFTRACYVRQLSSIQIFLSSRDGEMKILMMLTEHERDSRKAKLWCTLMKSKVNSPFFFEGPTVIGDSSLAMMNTLLRHITMGTTRKSQKVTLIWQ
jgi:hypothetical protein